MCINDNKRDLTFDIFKGIAITFVVVGHVSWFLHYFIYLFHVALFFICSGLFFKEKYYKSKEGLIKFVKSRIRHLYIPFILWNVFLIMIHNFLLKINVITNNQNFLSLSNIYSFGFFKLKENYTISDTILKIINTLLFSHGEQLGGATWFLRVLFWVSISTLIGHFLAQILIKNEKVFNIFRFLCFSIALLIGFGLQKIGFKFYSIGAIFTCSFLYYLGIVYQLHKDKIDKNINIFSFMLNVIILIISYKYIGGKIELAENTYPNPLWLIIVSIAGFIVTLYISKLLYKINAIKSLMSYIGQHTISIMLFHLAGFKFVTYMQVLLYSKPDYYLAAFPTLINNSYWWFVYFVVGIVLPLLLVFVWQKFLLLIKTIFKGNYILN